MGGLRDREKEERTAGTWAWEPKEKVIRWTIPSMIASGSSSTWSLKGTFVSTDTVPRPSRSIMTSFRIPQLLFSGLKVEQLKVTGEPYKPFKGVRTISNATVEWRW
ncbi:hypothetical protein FRB99_006901 [Tulasnella sp. 403]|nr:hypothetical protein FRB99_006901 [Tulasnella sp. 403]